MAEFDFDRAVTWAKLDRSITLRRRDETELPFIASVQAGPDLLLDSCVYIDRLQGKLPPIIDALLDLRPVNHSTVAMAELMYVVGRLDPADARTAPTISSIGSAVKLMKPHRLFEPDADIVGRAAILGGVLSRTQGYGKDDRLRAINDSVIFLHAAKLGLTVLSRNTRDFDLLSQLLPAARVLFYRQG